MESSTSLKLSSHFDASDPTLEKLLAAPLSIYYFHPRSEPPSAVPIRPKGAATKFCLWGDRFIGTKTHLPPKFSFSLDFGHFRYFENNVKCKILIRVKKEVTEMSLVSGGTSPADFSTGGDAPPRSPGFRRPCSSRPAPPSLRLRGVGGSGRGWGSASWVSAPSRSVS